MLRLLLSLTVLSVIFACPQPSPLPTAICDSTTNAWIIVGDTTVIDALYVGLSNVEVHGSILILPTATVHVSIFGGVAGHLMVAGQAALSGALNVSYFSQPFDGLHTLVTASEVINAFQVTIADLLYLPNKCDRVDQSQETLFDNHSATQLQLSIKLSDICARDEHDYGAVGASASVAGLFVVSVVTFWAATAITQRK